MQRAIRDVRKKKLRLVKEILGGMKKRSKVKGMLYSFFFFRLLFRFPLRYGNVNL